MRIEVHAKSSGIALIIVLLVMVVLGILAGGFAYSMKVETTLARKAVFDPEMDWIGRSGIELARYIIVNSGADSGGRYHALNQKWAGGTGDTNSGLADLPMENVPLGNGRFTLKIVDLDRKWNINVLADPRRMESTLLIDQALILVGVDAAETPLIRDSILDWIDPDDATHLSGTDGEDYVRNPNFGFPPYRVKNGWFDDITELLLVRGVTPAMFWGSSGGSYVTALPRLRPSSLRRPDEPVYMVGLAELFTTLSSGGLNVNTASATTLQVLPMIDENIAHGIVMARAGPDGVEGNEDDMPFNSPQEVLARVPGFIPNMNLPFTVKSSVFEARVTVELSGSKREYVAVLFQDKPRDAQVISMYWR